MRCPACRTSLLENDAACARCGFSLDQADRRLGIAPMLDAVVSDPQRLLSGAAVRSIAKAVRQLELRFPQMGFAAVLAQVPADVSPAIYAFWLFNRGSLSSAVEKGGENHRILLLIDTTVPRAAMIIGYGLEPFVSEEHLDGCLKHANEGLASRRYAEAIEAVIAELQKRFTDISQALPRTFGYSDGPGWIDATDPQSDDAAIAGNDPIF